MRGCGLGRREFALGLALLLGGDDGVHGAVFGQEKRVAGRDVIIVLVHEVVPLELQALALVRRGQAGRDSRLARGDDRTAEARLTGIRAAEGHAGGDDGLHRNSAFGGLVFVTDEPAKRGTAVQIVGAHNLQGTSPCVGYSRQDVSKTEQVPT